MAYDKEKQAEYMREWREKNREKIAAYQRDWMEKNKDHRREYVRRKRAENPEKFAARERRWRDKNPDYQRDYRMRTLYGISAQEYDAMLEAQGEGCAICESAPGEKRLSVDHCHTTGRVRGILCASCNSLLGMARDDPGMLDRAKAYLGN